MLIDGERETKSFKCKDDVLEVIDLIIAETKQVNEEKGVSFDIANSVISQLPFFGCVNIFFDKDIQRDIQRYVYWEKFGVPPYKGSYGEQPERWIRRVFSIKAALAKKENKEINSARQNNNKIPTKG